MKVSNKIPNAIQGSEAAKTTKTGADSIIDGKRTKSSQVSSGGAEGSTRVDVSSRAQEMAKAKELATPSDSIDEAKVARLQKLIDSGKYKVDADALADRLLDEQMKMNS